MNNTTARRWATAILAAPLMAWAPGAVQAQAQEIVRVGQLSTYSGPSGLAGQSGDNVIKIFQKKYGDAPGGKKIEFVKRDVGGPNPEVAKRLAHELIVREKVQIILGPDFTPNALAVAPLVTEAKVPAIITGAATQGIVGEKSPYYLRTFFTVPQVVKPLAQWAYRGGLRKPLLLIADYGPGQDAEASFTKTFTELGGSIAGVVRIPVRNPEFSGYMQRIKDAQPDTVFVFLPIGELTLQFLKAYADAGLKSSSIKLIATGDLTDESTLDAAGDTALDVITAGTYSGAHDSALNRQVTADYTAAYGKSPRTSLSTTVMWDSLRLLYDGLAAQQGSKFDADKFMAFAKGRQFESPRGPITLDKTTGDIVQNVYIRRVERRDGVLQNVEFETIKDVPAR